MARSGPRGGYFRATGMPEAKIKDIMGAYRRAKRAERLALLAENSPIVGNIVRQVQADLLGHLGASVRIMQNATTKTISDALDIMITRAVKIAYVQIQEKLAKRIAADIKAIIMQTMIKGKGSPQDILIAQTEAVMSRSARLLFPDKSPVVQQLLQIRQADVSIGIALKERVPYIVRAALVEAFMSAWAGLSEDQFPIAYRTLILEVINTKLKLQLLGWSVSSWFMAINFNQLFGDYGDLTEGYHYGALLATSQHSFGSRSAFGPYEKVSLPWRSAKLLKNPAKTRYAFWVAIWKNSKFYSPFSVGGRPAYKVSKRSYAAGASRAKAKAIEDYTKTRERILESVQKDATLKDGKVLFKNAEALEKHKKRIARLGSIKKSAEILTTRETVEPLPIPPGLKIETILARSSYWASKGIAPVWLLLQYGQVRYAPIIPPKGVFERFRALVNVRLSEAIAVKYNTMYGKLAYNRQGNVIIPPDRPVDLPLPLGITGSQRYIPAAGDKLYPVVEKAKKTILRTAAEASKINMTPPPDPVAAKYAYYYAREAMGMVQHLYYVPAKGMGGGIMGDPKYREILRRTGGFDNPDPTFSPGYRSLNTNLNPDMVAHRLFEQNLARMAAKEKVLKAARTRRVNTTARRLKWDTKKSQKFNYFNDRTRLTTLQKEG